MTQSITSERLEETVVRLVATLDPEEVLLFGSRARGTHRPDSDADLLVVLRAGSVPSGDPRALAWKTVRGDVEHPGILADVFTYYPEDLRRRLAAGSTVVRDALAEGVLLYPRHGGRSQYAELAGEWARVGAVDEWLRFAEEDLGDAEARLTDRRPVWRNIAYHAQQAAEKAIKALIFHLGGPLNRTHDILELLLTVSDLNRDIGTAFLLAHGNAGARLTGFAVEPRYPGDTTVTQVQAKEALETAQGIVAMVRAAISPGA